MYQTFLDTKSRFLEQCDEKDVLPSDLFDSQPLL